MKRFGIVGLGLTLLFLFLGACAPKGNESSTCGFVQNVYGERISWKGRVPVEMRLHQSVPEEYRQAMVSAAEVWNKALGRTIIVVNADQPLGGPVESKKDNQNVIYFYPTWEAERNTEQARTSIYWKGDTIEEADIRINTTNFSYYVQTEGKTSPTNKVNVEALVIHEMGHVLGLRHNDIVGGSVMASTLKSGYDRTKLVENDVKSLKCEY